MVLVGEKTDVDQLLVFGYNLQQSLKAADSYHSYVIRGILLFEATVIVTFILMLSLVKAFFAESTA